MISSPDARCIGARHMLKISPIIGDPFENPTEMRAKIGGGREKSKSRHW